MMLASGYVPGAVSDLLRKSPKKKKKVKQNEASDTKNLSSLFTAPLKQIHTSEKGAQITSTGNKKKRKSNDDDELAVVKKMKTKTAKSDGEPEASVVKKKEHPIRHRKSFYLDPAEKKERTVFVGNLPVDTDKKILKKLFKPCGEIESVRFRSAAPADAKMRKRVAVIKHQIHPSRNSINGFVVYKEDESAKNALKLNGIKFQDHILRVDLVANEKQHDHKKSIFIGNLPFNIADDVVREHFVDCGNIVQVRIVRDKNSRIGKGIAYIEFENTSAVHFALKLDGHSLANRQLRVRRSDAHTASKPKEGIKIKNDRKKNKHSTSTGNMTKTASFVGTKATSLEKMKRKKSKVKKIKKQKEQSMKKKKFNRDGGKKANLKKQVKDSTNRAPKKMSKKKKSKNKL